MIRNLGKALSIVAKAEVDEMIMHADVDAWYAPSECHGLVSKGEAKRMRRARKHAEAVAKAPYRVILAEAKKRVPKWGRYYDECIGRINARDNPF